VGQKREGKLKRQDRHEALGVRYDESQGFGGQWPSSSRVHFVRKVHKDKVENAHAAALTIQRRQVSH